jgi:hypothetical protein
MMAMATSSRSRLRMEQYQAGQKERGARQLHKRLLYCVNLNHTSLDHLLLGKNADIDQMSSSRSIPRDQENVPSRLWRRPPSSEARNRCGFARARFEYWQQPRNLQGSLQVRP